MLYREDLDSVGCTLPGCDHEHHGGDGIFLHSKCHLGSGMEVEYVDGKIIVRCLECKNPVATIAVASRGFLN
jgi:hypothetical protein